MVMHNLFLSPVDLFSSLYLDEPSLSHYISYPTWMAARNCPLYSSENSGVGIAILCTWAMQNFFLHNMIPQTSVHWLLLLEKDARPVCLSFCFRCMTWTEASWPIIFTFMCCSSGSPAAPSMIESQVVSFLLNTTMHLENILRSACRKSLFSQIKMAGFKADIDNTISVVMNSVT